MLVVMRNETGDREREDGTELFDYAHEIILDLYATMPDRD